MPLTLDPDKTHTARATPLMKMVRKLPTRILKKIQQHLRRPPLPKEGKHDSNLGNLLMPFPTITVKTGKGDDHLSTRLAPQLRPVVMGELEVWKLRFPDFFKAGSLVNFHRREAPIGLVNRRTRRLDRRYGAGPFSSRAGAGLPSSFTMRDHDANALLELSAASLHGGEWACACSKDWVPTAPPKDRASLLSLKAMQEMEKVIFQRTVT